MRNVILAILILLLAAAPTALAKDVDRTIAVEDGTEISLELIAGEVTIVGWDRREVSITGTLDDRYEELDVSHSGKSLDIEIDIVDGKNVRMQSGAELEIRLPRDCDLSIETISAGLEISDVTGRIRAETISGNVTIDADRLELELSSISGKTEVRADLLTEVQFEAVSGSAEFEADLADGDFSFEMVTGNLTLRLPSSVSARFEIESFSGSIDNEFGPEAERTSDFLPSKSLEFSTGGGAASVTIENFQGSTRLVRK